MQDCLVPLTKLCSAASRLGATLETPEQISQFLAAWRQIATTVAQLKKPTRKNFGGLSEKELEAFNALLL